MLINLKNRRLFDVAFMNKRRVFGITRSLLERSRYYVCCADDW